MRTKNKKKQLRKKKINKKEKKISILPILLFIGLLSLFSETMRTIPAGAISENFINIPYELPKLNSSLVEKKYLNNSSLTFKKDIDFKKPKKILVIKKEEKIIQQEEIKIAAKTPEIIKDKV